MRNGQLPSNWSIQRLESVAQIRTGLALGKRHVANPVRLPYLRVANVQDGHLKLDEIKYVTVCAEEVDRYRLVKGDILLTEGGDFDKLGRGTMWRGELDPCLHQNHIFVVRTERAKLLPEYLEWLTSSPYGRYYFRKCSKQSTNLASINSSQLKAFPIPLPPHREQREIADVLHTWDSGIRDSERLLKLKRRLKRGLMQQLLTGRHRFPQFAGKQWREVRIDEVLNEQFRSVAWDDDALYRLASVRRNSKGLFWRDALYGRQIKVKKLHTIRAGDFLLSHIQAAYGAMALVPSEFDGGHVSDMYTILRSRDSSVFDIGFFGFLAERAEMRHAAYVSSNGFFAERLRLNFDPHDFLRRKILIPPTVAEQQKIAAVLTTADREIDLLEQQIAALREQKKGLMQKLLTGKLRIKVKAEQR